MQLISNEEVRQELNDIDNLTEERLDELLDRFLRDFEADALEARGWPMGCSAYKVAKAAMNAYSRILARRHPELRVNCAHPGYVKTDIKLRDLDARGGRAQRGEGGAGAGGRAAGQVLRRRAGGACTVSSLAADELACLPSDMVRD